MSKDDYRDNAAECLRLASGATNPRMRASLLRMAESWLRLHDQAKKNAQLDLSYETPPRHESVPQPQQQQQQRAKDEGTGRG
jgi:hypothetical protein